MRRVLCTTRAILLILILVVSSGGVCLAFPVTSVVFRGNVHVNAKYLTQALAISPDNPLSRDFPNRSELLLEVQHITEVLKAFYTREGYLYASIDSFNVGLTLPFDSAQGYQVVFYLQERVRYTLTSISIAGASLFSESDLRGRMASQIGEPLDETVLQRDLNLILARYEHEGFPFAKIDVVSILPRLDSSSGRGELSLNLRVEEGHRARIGKVLISGNTTTDPKVITRELRIIPGSYYNADDITRARARAERLGFFESVSEPDLFLQNDSVVSLLIRVKEANTSAIDGVLGYNPARNSSESGYISGIVDLSFRNISGTGRNASLNYNRETRLSQLLEVHYLEPWLFGYPINIAIGFLQRQQDTTFTRTALTGDLSLAISQDISLIGTLTLDRVIPTDLPNLPFSVYDSRTLTTGLSAATDSRDNSVAARSGVLASLGASYGQKLLFGPGRFLDSSISTSEGLRSIFLDATGYHALFSPKVIGVVGLHARSVAAIGGQLDQGDLFRIGGIYSIRGYREAELLASRYAYGNLEMRLMTSELSFFFVFFDGGYLAKESTRSDSVEHVLYPLSYGFGAQVESPFGVLSVSIGLAKSEPIEQAKFHFGLIKQF